MSLRRIAVPLAAALSAAAFSTPSAFAAPNPSAQPTSPSPAPQGVGPRGTATGASTQPAATPTATGTPRASATPSAAPSSPSATPSAETKSASDSAKESSCDELSIMCSGGAAALARAQAAASNPPSVPSASGAAASASMGGSASAYGRGAPYINAVAPMAIDAMNTYGVPASVSIAQSILESGWGESGLTVSGNAYFGIKCSPNGYMSPWQSTCLDFPTQEWSARDGYYWIHSYFRAYPNERASFMDHGLFLRENQRYASAFTTNNADDFIREVQRDGYATEPSYADLVINIMRSYDLYQFDSGSSNQIQGYWAQQGGASGWMGKSTSDLNCGLTGGGCWMRFEHALAYWSPAGGTHAIPYGAIHDRYAQLGYELSFLGYPTSDAVWSNGNAYQLFENGVIYYTPQTGAWANSGAIRGRYRALNSEHGVMGWPTGPEVCGIKNDGCYQTFQGGVIYWSASTGAWESRGAIRTRYRELGLEHSGMGLPTSAESCTLDGGGCYQFYEGGVIYWSPSTGAWESRGAIRGKYASMGYERSGLGLPAGPESCGIKNDGCYQLYQGGVMYWSEATGTHPMWGAIRGSYAASKYERGPLGLPVSDEACGIKDDGCYQLFEGGAVYWSPRTGAWPNIGAIRGRYAALGSEHSQLGLPTSGEQCGLPGGGCQQSFQGGTIVWTPSTGAWPTWGAIGDRYRAMGSSRSALGAPTSAESCTIKNGGCFQFFQGGVLYWSPDSGAWETAAPLRSYYEANGLENGSLGYPVGAMVTNGDGSVTQPYQGGTLRFANGSYSRA